MKGRSGSSKKPIAAAARHLGVIEGTLINGVQRSRAEREAWRALCE